MENKVKILEHPKLTFLKIDILKAREVLGGYYSKIEDTIVVAFKKVFRKNKKNQKDYMILSTEVINCTNYANNKKMVLYSDGDNLYVRDLIEFEEKFE